MYWSFIAFVNLVVLVVTSIKKHQLATTEGFFFCFEDANFCFHNTISQSSVSQYCKVSLFIL